MRSYRQHIDSYLIPNLGCLRLGDLRTTHVEKMLHDIAQPPAKPKAGEKIGKGQRRNPKKISRDCASSPRHPPIGADQRET